MQKESKIVKRKLRQNKVLQHHTVTLTKTNLNASYSACCAGARTCPFNPSFLLPARAQPAWAFLPPSPEAYQHFAWVLPQSWQLLLWALPPLLPPSTHCLQPWLWAPPPFRLLPLETPSASRLRMGDQVPKHPSTSSY